ncbi:tRNA (adenosine(37)-N6)-threonylcarbamoyltransferase complex dimerization subunit type 1 TsaB [Planctomycetota bacterium]
MRLLAIETSTGVGSVAVLDEDGGVRDQISFPEGTKHGISLVPSIRDILERAGWEPAGLDAVAVSIGPGSYTGLRVGLVSAKMLAAFGGADLVAVPSLDVIAYNADTAYEDVCVVEDARRDQVYAARYERQETLLRRISDYAVVAPKELLGSLREDTILVGDGIPIVRAEAGGTPVRVAAEEQWIPQAYVVAEIGTRLHAQGVRSDSYSTEPMYLRKVAAEEQWTAREAASK